jgi:coenzyme F420-0:L-glutamate ligase / coenzyme F420-1:gamma-L-glutamate ligase
MMEASAAGISSAEWPALVAGRRSIRRYVATPLEPARVERLLCAAAWAPSAHNRQPWRFVLIEEDRWKERLAAAMGEKLRRDRLADGDPAVDVERDVARSYARLTEAPLLILVCLSLSERDRYPDERRRRAEHLMAVQSTAMATQNLLLAAHAEGLGAAILCAPLFCPETVAAALGLPEDWDPQGLLTLGWPANGGKPAIRRPLADIVWRPGAPL